MTGVGAPAGSVGPGRSLAIGAAVVALALALIWGAGSGMPQPVGRGTEAPDFELEELGSDTPIALASLRGRVVLLNFWATWCKPCEEEMPSMERLYRSLHPQGLELIAVSVDEDPSLVADFRDRMAVSFPIALDPDQEISRLYQTRGYPESLLVDRDGTVLERYVGPRDWEIYRDRIQELVAAGG